MPSKGHNVLKRTVKTGYEKPVWFVMEPPEKMEYFPYLTNK